MQTRVQQGSRYLLRSQATSVPWFCHLNELPCFTSLWLSFPFCKLRTMTPWGLL